MEILCQLQDEFELIILSLSSLAMFVMNLYNRSCLVFYILILITIMSQKVLFLTLPFVLIIGWCFNTSSSTETTSDTTENLSWTTTMNATTPSLEDCKAAVEQYLTATKEYKIDSSKKVTKNASIVVDYVGRLADGTVFDTSVESVAKACGLYTAQRNYSEWLAFTAWAGQMIAGFDAWVIDMSLNETKTVTILSKDAYGTETVSYGIENLPTKPDGSTYKAGESIMTVNWAIKIESINDKEFTIKNSHPLAGKDLIFDITIKTIK